MLFKKCVTQIRQTNIPPKAIDEMVDLSSFGAHFEMSTFMAGKVTPAPRPSRIRIMMRYSNPAWEHPGLRRVATMLRTTAPKNIHLPPNCSASHPPGTWVMR